MSFGLPISLPEARPSNSVTSPLVESKSVSTPGQADTVARDPRMSVAEPQSHCVWLPHPFGPFCWPFPHNYIGRGD